MYRPREPENRRPASSSASAGQRGGMPYRGSLLDRLDDDRFQEPYQDENDNHAGDSDE